MLSCGLSRPVSASDGAWLRLLTAHLQLSERHCPSTFSMQPCSHTLRSVSYRTKHRPEATTAQSETVSRPSAARDQRKRPRRSASDKVSASPRATAVRQLVRIQDEGAYIKQVSGLADLDPGHDTADRRIQRAVTELVAGVTRYRRRLDLIITQLTGRPIAKLDPVVREVLRVGIYEIGELGLADHAIGAHVDITKALAQPHLGSFVNGVLRTAVRRRAAGTLFLTPEGVEAGSATADQIAEWYSHPTWMVDRWLKQHGTASTIALLKHNNRRPAYGVRFNGSTRGISVEQLLAELQDLQIQAGHSSCLPEEFIRVESGMQQLIQRGYLATGKCQVQDEAAGAVVAFLEPQPGEAILDACAAPGGKTTFIAQRMRGKGRLVAMDVSDSRLQPLRDAVAQQQLEALVHVQVMDVREHAAAVAVEVPASPGFDRVLVDVPCSGTGVLSKRADLRWRRQLSDIVELTCLQDEMLDAAASLVAPGGLLVYSTCSIEPEENEDRVTAFLSRHDAFTLEQPSSGVLRELSQAGTLNILPHEHGIDGAFAARLRKACSNLLTTPG